MIVLIGFMGAGKSTVGTALAARLDEPFVDTDSVIEEREGRSVADIFDTQGEGHFRAVERDVVLEALSRGSGVVALGGGAVTNPDVRAVLEGHNVVHLSVTLDEAMRRLSGDSTRPLLRNKDEIPVLYQYRRALYEEVASATVATDDRSVTECADEIVTLFNASLDTSTIRVELDERGYDVVVGRGIAGDLSRWLPESLEPERAVVITHGSIRPVADAAALSLRDRGIESIIVEIAEGERSKSVATAGSLWDELAEAGLHRNDLVVGVGGGVVTDIAGFVASTYARGIAVAHVPTTLLAQVDAAVGGKTGIDLEAGKNLVGTFHQPSVVVVDVQTIATLPEDELRSGLAESIKAGLIADEGLVDLIASEADRLAQRDLDVVREVVERSIAIKAEIVSRDEKEGGVRAWLNYGHTFAHAIEKASAYRGIRHGEAVAVGMMAAAYLAEELGRLSPGEVERHRVVLEAVGLPVTMQLDIDELERAWLLDKKYLRGVRFVVLDAIGRPVAGVTAPREALEKAIERVAG